MGVKVKKQKRLVKKKKIKRKQAIKNDRFKNYEKVDDMHKRMWSNFQNYINPLELKIREYDSQNRIRDMEQQAKQHMQETSHLKKVNEVQDREIRDMKAEMDQQQEELNNIQNVSKRYVDYFTGRIDELEDEHNPLLSTRDRALLTNDVINEIESQDSTRVHVEATASASKSPRSSLAQVALAHAQTPIKQTPAEKTQPLPTMVDLNTRTVATLPHMQGNLDNFIHYATQSKVNNELEDIKSDLNRYSNVDVWAQSNNAWNAKKKEVDWSKAKKQLEEEGKWSENMKWPKSLLRRKEMMNNLLSQ